MEEEGERGPPDEGYLLLRIHVPELNVQKCLQFPRDQLVWDVKQQCLAALPKELKESFNYGLFCPPENGRAGKFLDEERRLGDYPFNEPVGFLELKYKRRVYKMLSLDEKQLKNLHTRANLRRFLDYVHNGQVEKVTKMCSKGLDPNFHCPESGETPLTIGTGIKKPAKMLIALVNGGALLDYRTKDGSTAMHRSVEHKSLEAMKTLLELGASPNYKDAKGLTPLYLTITQGVDAVFTECLLHDHATTGAQDSQGWQEVHQACKNGLQQHLEHLLFYGADMNGRNASGNTPLHVCAVNGQESCARQLLFRGADREALNYANQTACQVAVIAANMELADTIQNYKQEDVVPYRGPPSYNPKRRSAVGWLHRVPSMSTLALLPPSPCPSDRSSVPFSSASSSMSDGSSTNHHQTGHEIDTASIITDKSLGDTSDIISDSSGVGTANSDTTNCSLSIPGSTVVCIEPYNTNEEGHINIQEGDILEVTGTTDDGFLEGTLKGNSRKSGLFPASCVHEVRLRTHVNAPMMVAKDSKRANNRVVGRRESTSQHFATAPRLKQKYGDGERRNVVLHRGRKGFGFILRGAKATSPLMELTPSDKCPALQYLDDVDPGGVADLAGLKKGDFLLEINNEDVSSASHEHVVDLIRKSGNLVQMTVMSLGVVNSIPMSKSTILPGNGSEVPLSRQYATLPRKLGANCVNFKSQAPLPPRRDPKTTLSVGRARAKSMVAGLGEEKELDFAKCESVESISQPRTASIRQRPNSSRVNASELEAMFEIQREVNSKMMTTSRFHESSSPVKSRVYASVAEMKRSKMKNSKVRFTSPGGELRRDFHSTPDLAQGLECSTVKNHHSQEDLAALNRSQPPEHPPPPPPLPAVQVMTLGRRALGYDGKNGAEDGVVSSFRPTASAKLYASPEDVKNVGFRSKSLPSHSARPHVRKSSSMRSNSSSTFKPLNNSTPSAKKENANPYAQPIRTASRSNSTAGVRERRRKISSSKSATNIVVTNPANTPAIPDPDYSCSESERESEDESKEMNLAARLAQVHLQPVENSGNSNTSGSSSGSSSMPHSFSVHEIQKGRSLLKSSKSYPEDFLKKQKDGDVGVIAEDGDNSSSGVSSDQEISTGVGGENVEKTHQEQQHSFSLATTKTQNRTHPGLLSRNAVSLAQLPPPLESDGDEKEEFCLPPPPEFEEINQNANNSELREGAVVLAPPPQFSDNRQVTRVRIVGTVPKDMPKLKQNRLHSQ